MSHNASVLTLVYDGWWPGVDVLHLEPGLGKSCPGHTVCLTYILASVRLTHGFNHQRAVVLYGETTVLLTREHQVL